MAQQVLSCTLSVWGTILDGIYVMYGNEMRYVATLVTVCWAANFDDLLVCLHPPVNIANYIYVNTALGGSGPNNC